MFDLGCQTGFANARFAGDEDYLRLSPSRLLNEQAEGAEFVGPTEYNRTGDGGRKLRLHPLRSFPSFQPVFALSSTYLWELGKMHLSDCRVCQQLLPVLP